MNLEKCLAELTAWERMARVTIFPSVLAVTALIQTSDAHPQAHHTQGLTQSHHSRYTHTAPNPTHVPQTHRNALCTDMHIDPASTYKSSHTHAQTISRSHTSQPNSTLRCSLPHHDTFTYITVARLQGTWCSLRPVPLGVVQCDALSFTFTFFHPHAVLYTLTQFQFYTLMCSFIHLLMLTYLSL